MELSRRALGLCALGTLSALLLTGCPKSNETGSTGGGTTGSSTGGSAGGKPIHVAFVTNGSSNFWTIAQKGCDQAHKEMPNVDVSFQIPSDTSAAAQKQIIDDLLVKGIQGIAISPLDPANQTEELNRAAKQAVLMTQDSDAPKSNRVCYIGTDNHAAGLQAGQLIKEALPQGGKIMLFVGKKDVQNAKDREQGIRDAIKGTNIQIIDVRTDDGDHNLAKNNAADALVKYPDLAGMVGLWSYNGPAIIAAAKAGNKVGKVKIVCFDEEEDTLSGIKDGSVYGTVVQQPYEFGHQTVLMLAKVIGHDTSGIPASKQIFVPTQMIKKDNVDAFSTKLHGLIGK